MEVVGVVSFCVITFLCQVRFDLLGHRFLTNYFSLLLIIVLFIYNKDIKSRKCAAIISSYINAFFRRCCRAHLQRISTLKWTEEQVGSFRNLKPFDIK